MTLDEKVPLAYAARMQPRVELVPVPIADYPIIQNLAALYVYDISEYMYGVEGWQTPKDGVFTCYNFRTYWDDPTASPFLVYVDGELAGFAIIDKRGSDAKVDYNMAQFFILRKFTHKGIGRAVAMQCFQRFLGTWEVMVLPPNLGAYRFWTNVIAEYTQGNFEEYTRRVKLLTDTDKRIFRFQSR